MTLTKFKTRVEFAQELGMSTKTLLRKLKAANYALQPGLISPEHQLAVLRLFGCICGSP